MLLLILKAAFIIPQLNNDTDLDNVVSVLKEAGSQGLFVIEMD